MYKYDYPRIVRFQRERIRRELWEQSNDLEILSGVRIIWWFDLMVCQKLLGSSIPWYRTLSEFMYIYVRRDLQIQETGIRIYFSERIINRWLVSFICKSESQQKCTAVEWYNSLSFYFTIFTSTLSFFLLPDRIYIFHVYMYVYVGGWYMDLRHFYVPFIST